MEGNKKKLESISFQILKQKQEVILKKQEYLMLQGKKIIKIIITKIRILEKRHKVQGVLLIYLSKKQIESRRKGMQNKKNQKNIGSKITLTANLKMKKKMTPMMSQTREVLNQTKMIQKIINKNTTNKDHFYLQSMIQNSGK